jgi:hypothetical protein
MRSVTPCVLHLCRYNRPIRSILWQLSIAKCKTGRSSTVSMVSSRVIFWCQLDNATNTKHAKKPCSYWISVNHFLQKHSQSVEKIISAKKRIFIILLNIHSGTRGQIEWLKIKKWSTFLVATIRLTSVIDCSCQLSELGVSLRRQPLSHKPDCVIWFETPVTLLDLCDSYRIHSDNLIMSCLLLTAVLQNLQPHIAGKKKVFCSNHKIKNISLHLSDQKRMDDKG